MTSPLASKQLKGSKVVKTQKSVTSRSKEKEMRSSFEVKLSEHHKDSNNVNNVTSNQTA